MSMPFFWLYCNIFLTVGSHLALLQTSLKKKKHALVFFYAPWCRSLGATF